MGLDMWFREDVARMLACTQETMRNSLCSVAALDTEVAAAYRRGFGDALHALAVAFGVGSPMGTRADMVEPVLTVGSDARPTGSGQSGGRVL